MAQVTIRIRIDGDTGRGWLVDESDRPIPLVEEGDKPIPLDKVIPLQVYEQGGKMSPTVPPDRELTAAEHRRVYQANGFKLVGSLYHSHSSPGCLYWIGSTPVILPCP